VRFPVTGIRVRPKGRLRQSLAAMSCLRGAAEKFLAGIDQSAEQAKDCTDG